MAKLWLRAETYGNPKPDTRSPLTPEQAKILVDQGHEVTVERSPHRVFGDADYQKAGCKMVEPGGWYDVSDDTFVLGIKYLPKEERFSKQFPLPQKMIYFAHAWNGDADASRITSRLEEQRDIYSATPTPFYDLEDLTDDKGKRVAAFGYYAGYSGAICSVNLWCQKQLGGQPPYQAPDPEKGREGMVAELRQMLAEVKAKTGKTPDLLVIAPNGRCGKGAVGLLDELGLAHTDWTREQTKKGYPFPEVFDHDILLNCVSFSPENPRLITADDLNKDMRLSVVGDISCYPGPFNPINIYPDVTSYSNMSHTVPTKSGPLDVIAIENLPRLLAKEASQEYSALLFPHIQELLEASDKGVPPSDVWKRADHTSHGFMAGAGEIKDIGRVISLHCFGKDGKLDTQKADAMLTEWLERKPLKLTQRQGIKRFLLDGSAHVHHLREGRHEPEIQQQFRQLEQWVEQIDIQKLCSEPNMAAHHAVENEADRFLTTPAGKALMQNPELRRSYMQALDAAHHTLGGNEQAAEHLSHVVDNAKHSTGKLSGGKMIAQAFDNIKNLASPILGFASAR